MGENWRQFLTKVGEVPGDVASACAVTTIVGKNLIYIENYQSILRYTEEELIILTKKGKLTICGKKLKIPAYSKEEMEIRGFISSIFLES